MDTTSGPNRDTLVRPRGSCIFVKDSRNQKSSYHSMAYHIVR